MSATVGPAFRERLAARAAELPVLVALVAAVEAALVRTGHANHPTEPALFVHAALLWGSFALLALVPAALVARRRAASPSEPSEPTGIGDACRFLFLLVVPVVAHQVLDRHTAIGQNVRALFTLRPWLEVLGAVAALAVALLLVARLARRLPRRRVALAVLVPSLVVGLFLPRNPGPSDPPESIPAELAGRPNVLLLVWDTTRAANLATYGYERETTPALAKLAEESLVFEEARSVSVFTFTSHLSMLTGKYPGATGARLFRMRVDPRLAESVAIRFAEAGYRTGAFVGTWVLAATSGIQQGFEVYDDRVDPDVCLTLGWQLVHDVQAVLSGKLGWFTANGQPHWFQDFQRPAEEVLARALEWIRRDDPRPWFAMINLYDVHWPYVPDGEAAERFLRPYGGPMDGYLFRSDRYPEGHEPTAEDGAHLVDLYDAELWELDRRVDAFLAALDLGRSNTAVLCTSDHGEAFGEAGRFEHQDILEPQVRVPFLVRAAGPEPPSGRRDAVVSGVDVGPTLLGLAGLEVPDGLHGIDLTAEVPPPEREVLVEDRDYGTADQRRLALYSGEWKLVRAVSAAGTELRLYHLPTDPTAAVDVAAEHPERTAELDRRLTELRADWAHIDEGLELVGLGASADALGQLGYLETEGEGDEEGADGP